MYSGTYNTCSFIISQVQLNSAHSSDPIFTSLSHLLVFFHRWTHVVISPVDFHSLSVMHFQQVFCAQCHCLRVIKTLHPIQPYEKYTVGSIDCACNSIYFVCCRNTSTKNRVVLYIVKSTMQNKHNSNRKFITKYFSLFTYISHFIVPSDCHLTLCMQDFYVPVSLSIAICNYQKHAHQYLSIEICEFLAQ